MGNVRTVVTGGQSIWMSERYVGCIVGSAGTDEVLGGDGSWA